VKRQAILSFASATLFAACTHASADKPPPPDANALIPGVWASGDTAAACKTAPVSYYVSDGTYLVFDRFDGPLHAVGRWRVAGGNVFLTHNDSPFPADGAASAEAELTLRRVDAAVFETANKAGQVRVRTRCTGLVLPPGAAEGAAH
jgi:hypothetical protein